MNDESVFDLEAPHDPSGEGVGSYNKRMMANHPGYYTFACCGETLLDNPYGCMTGWHQENGYRGDARLERVARYEDARTSGAKKIRP